MNNKYWRPEDRGETLEKNLDYLTELIRKDEGRVAALNVERMQQLQLAYDIFKKIVIGEDVSVSYQTNKPFPSMGSISVEADLLALSDPELFHVVAKLANNMEVYPLTDGKVRMTFTFHGLTMPLE